MYINLLNPYLKQRFGQKLYKLALDGGMTCPNRDGTLGNKGCIFCSAGGSGDFASDSRLSVTDQIASAKTRIQNKYHGNGFIAYFQAYTNTYAPVEYLRKLFTEAIMHPDIKVLSIATRPDCLPHEVLDLLEELNRIKPVWIELGLQTIHDRTSTYIRRGYQLDCFEHALSELNRRSLEVIVHVILGLPGESRDELMETIHYLAGCQLQGVKLQLLHILKGTDLADAYLREEVSTLTLEEYTELICNCIEHLPKDFVIHRITGDGPKSLLLAPRWSADKKNVLNTLNRQFRLRNTTQGKYNNV